MNQFIKLTSYEFRLIAKLIIRIEEKQENMQYNNGGIERTESKIYEVEY